MRKDILNLTVICLLLAGTSASCQLLEAEFSIISGSPRTATERRRQADTTLTDLNPLPAFIPDTTVWVSAVVFPAGYDWQRDTAYGNVDARIVLLRDGKKVLEIPADGAAEAHRHHIVDGHIYSECGSGREKSVRRDGEPLFSMPAAESLCGVLEKNGAVFTLTKRSGARGFVLRSGAEALLSRDEGAPIGGFDDTSYAPGGALYEDKGKCCFAYSLKTGGQTRFFSVRDGVEAEEVQFRAADIQDLKLVGGMPLSSDGTEGGSIWRDAHIWRSMAMSGEVLMGSSAKSCVFRLPSGPLIELGPEGGAIYVSRTDERLVRWTQDGSINVWSQSGQSGIPGAYSVFYPSCGTLLGGELMLALTPRDSSAKARIFIGDTVQEIKVRGFLSGISVTCNDLPTLKK